MQRALISLSMVTALWERRRTDYLDNFVPFIATLAMKKGIEGIDKSKVSSLCEQFLDQFGLRIPYHPMIAILNRCKRRGLLRMSGLQYRINRALAVKLDFSSDEQVLTAKIRDVVTEFRRYAAEKYEIDCDEAMAETLILNLLKNCDIDILFASREPDSVLPELRLAKKYRRYQYVLQRFIIHIHEGQPNLYRELSDISLGHVISSAIIVEDYNWNGETVNKCEFYIDTPILFKLLGADGPEQEAACSDLLLRLLSHGAKLSIFDHTYVELNEILENSKNWVNSPEFDPERASKTALYFRQAGYSDLDIEKFILRVDSVLSDYGIERKSLPPFMELKQHEIGEEKLQDLLEEVTWERDPAFDKNLYETRTGRDVASVAAIYRLRGDSRPRLLRNAKYALITNNIALILANRRYMRDEWHYESELPACLTDVFVGTILWMNTPPEAREDCRKRLLADCYAAVRPDPLLEKRLLDEARRLKNSDRISRDDFMLLSTSFVIRDLLSDATLNDRDALTTETVFEILEKVKGCIKAEAIEPYARKIRELASEQAQALRERDSAVSAIEGIIDLKARRRAILSTCLWGLGALLGVTVPLGLSLFVKWYFLAMYAVVALLTAYMSFVKGFRFDANYHGVYQKYHLKLKEQLMPDSDGAANRQP